jgi:hypothetical protein
VDKDKQRLVRIALTLILLQFFIGLGIIAFVGYKYKDLPYIIAQINKQPGPAGKDGLDGKDGQITTLVTTQPGVPGANGKNGKDGKDGQSVTPEQIAQAVSVYLQSNPPGPGPKGEPGQDGTNGSSGTNGREIELRKKPNTLNEYQYRYKGDIGWQDISDGDEIE